MKPGFEEYLKQFEISETLMNRIEEIYKIYVDVLGFEIEDIFVSERLDASNKQEFLSLWFFHSEYLFEAKNFTTELNIDAIVVSKNILHWELKSREYDFRSSTEKSRFTVVIRQVPATLVSDMLATGKNCDQLLNVFQKYIQPNLVRGQS